MSSTKSKSGQGKGVKGKKPARPAAKPVARAAAEPAKRVDRRQEPVSKPPLKAAPQSGAKAAPKPLAKPVASATARAGKPHRRKPPAPAPSPHVAITEVGAGQCRFIVDDRKVPALCCGLPAAGGSWCTQHLAIVYTPTALRTVRVRERTAVAPRA